MRPTKFQRQLAAMGACDDACDWVGRKTLAVAWQTCRRGDWMPWLAARAGVDRRLIVLAACDCAEPALVHVPADEHRPRIAIETARAWCRGEATIEQVRDAANAAFNAARVGRAADAAAFAAAFATIATTTTDVAAFAANAVVRAADADVAARADAFADRTHAQSLAKSADLVRARIPLAVIHAALENR